MHIKFYILKKCSELNHQGEFLHNYYTFELVHDGDHHGVVRIVHTAGAV